MTIQYRLGPFGFLSLNDSTITPNLGLWDQNLALRWIQDNIGRFGGKIDYFALEVKVCLGDSKRVTIYGESAGSMSVADHTISPQSKGELSERYSEL